MNGNNHIRKTETGISGFDFIADGGFPEGRTVLVAGTSGSAKSVFAAQFLAEGIKQYEEPGVFITFEELPSDIRSNLKGFGWDIEDWESKKKWLFLDASPDVDSETIVTGDYDLGALLLRIEFAIKKIGAKRVVIDSLTAIFNQFENRNVVRRELFRINKLLKKLGVTAIITAERTEDYGEVGRFGVEEFVTDNVIILRNALMDEKRRRTIEILKFRGTTHKKGEYPFTILPGEGIIIVSLSAIELKQKSSDIRVSSGNSELDIICGGGFFRDSVILVSGATGTGKTLMVTEFMEGGVRHSDRCILFAFEESREQLFRNAMGWGVDFEKLEKEDKLRIVCRYPESATLEDHLIGMKKIIDEYRPNRIAVDSLSALERVSSIKGFREFVIGLTSYIKHKEMAGLFTATTPTLTGGTSVTEAHISSITDSIILLRYVELYGEMRRGLTVLKMRGSRHEKDIREYTIEADGMHIGKAFRNVSGILAGLPKQVAESELEQMDKLFQ